MFVIARIDYKNQKNLAAFHINFELLQTLLRAQKPIEDKQNKKYVALIDPKLKRQVNFTLTRSPST